MFVELHILQNFVPANLNRSDTGAPKDCEFGGYRRARISSQCLKRAIRRDGTFQAHLGTLGGVRTRRLLKELVDRLKTHGKGADEARSVAEAALQGIGLTVKPDPRTGEPLTEYLLFLGGREIDSVVEQIVEHWDELAAAGSQPKGGASKSGRAAKKEAKDSVPKPVADAFRRVLDGGKAADVALYGRMLADLPEKNVDAACQVAHAISTNAVNTEFDFYTAVDDIPRPDDKGAGMMGTIEFNSACFYRYANVDMDQLCGRNLSGDEDLARRSLDAFLRASIEAVPTGKVNSMAHHNPPSLVFAVVRERRLWSLANAFARPVAPDGDHDLVQKSERRLDEYWGGLTRMYGAAGITGTWLVTASENGGLSNLAREPLGKNVASVDELVQGVLEAIRFGAGSQPVAA